MTLADTLRDRLGVDLRDLAGAALAGELPVREDAVNRLIAERLRDHPQIAAVHVQAREGDAAAVHVVPRIRLMPALRLTAGVERQPQFPADPTLVLRWSMPAVGPLALLAAPVLSYFTTMPPGIRLEGHRLAIDIGELLRARGLGDLLGFLRRGTIHTRPGAFVVRFEIGVEG